MWTEQEVLLLRENYPKGKDVFSDIDRHTPNAIRIMACRLRLTRTAYRSQIRLTKEEKQVLLGTILGDSYCRIHTPAKNAQLEGAHCLKQESYMAWKLSWLSRKLHFNFRRTKTGQLFFESNCYPCLNRYHRLFYSTGKKRVTSEILNEVGPIALAFWYMDDGTYNHTNAVLCTQGFTYEEHVLMQTWFKKRFDMLPVIGTKRSKLYPDRYFLRFSTADTKKLFDLIKPYIHPTMLYKLGVQENQTQGGIHYGYQHANKEV